MTPALIVALGGLIGGPLIAYFGVVRRASGTIDTSEAGQLWEESRAIREWATARIQELNKTVNQLQDEVTRLEEMHRECQRERRKENHDHQGEVAKLEKKLSEMEAAA